jgi:hypothetical protein
MILRGRNRQVWLYNATLIEAKCIVYHDILLNQSLSLFLKNEFIKIVFNQLQIYLLTQFKC